MQLIAFQRKAMYVEITWHYTASSGEVQVSQVDRLIHGWINLTQFCVRRTDFSEVPGLTPRKSAQYFVKP